MKKITKYIFLPLLVLSTIGGAISGAVLIRKAVKKDEEAYIQPLPEVKKSTISYAMVLNDKVQEIPDFLFAPNGVYPTKYSCGTWVHVDDLRGKMTQCGFFFDDTEAPTATSYTGIGVEDPNGSGKEYEFYGWYMNVACTKEFRGYFEGDPTDEGRILYAKVKTSAWTKFY